MNTIKYIILLFFLWRIFLFVPLYIGEKVLPYRANYEYTDIWKFTKPYLPVNSIFLYPLANFDGVHYLSIAHDGYTENGRFFPLYPILIRFSSYPFGIGETFGTIQFFSAIIISNAALLLSLIVFYKLIRLDFSQSIAMFSLISLLVFPTSFFLGNIYAESLFLLLTFLSFYYARKGKWVYASFLGMLLTATRFVGIAIFPALLIELILQNKNKPVNLILKKSLPLFIIPLGIISFAVFNYFRWGNAFHFIQSQGEVANGRSVSSIVSVPQTIFRYFKILTTVSSNQFEWRIALLELATAFFTTLLLYIGWKQGIRLSYLVFCSICLLIPILSGTLSGLPRYSLLAFPIFMSLSLIKSKQLQTAYIVFSLVLLFILCMFFSRGYYVS